MENKVSYYKVIDGLNFDAGLLTMADELIKGQGDGRISIDDSNKLLVKIFDGGTITKVECRTILYILKNYKLTQEASQNFLDKLIKYDWERDLQKLILDVYFILFLLNYHNKHKMPMNIQDIPIILPYDTIAIPLVRKKKLSMLKKLPEKVVDISALAFISRYLRKDSRDT